MVQRKCNRLPHWDSNCESFTHLEKCQEKFRFPCQPRHQKLQERKLGRRYPGTSRVRTGNLTMQHWWRHLSQTGRCSWTVFMETVCVPVTMRESEHKNSSHAFVASYVSGNMHVWFPLAFTPALWRTPCNPLLSNERTRTSQVAFSGHSWGLHRQKESHVTPSVFNPVSQSLQSA